MWLGNTRAREEKMVGVSITKVSSMIPSVNQEDLFRSIPMKATDSK